MAITTWRSSVSGLRSHGLREFLAEVGDISGVELTVTERDKGIIGDSIYFTISGDEIAITKFKRLFNQSLAEHNRGGWRTHR